MVTWLLRIGLKHLDGKVLIFGSLQILLFIVDVGELAGGGLWLSVLVTCEKGHAAHDTQLLIFILIFFYYFFFFFGATIRTR